MKKLFFGLIIVLSVQACTSKLNMVSISNTKWVLTEWLDQTMPNTTKKATLDFGADNRISGKSFCNVFGGTVTIKNQSIKFSELISTMMYCDDVGEAESKFTEALKKANTFKVVDGKLQLLNEDKLLMVFSKVD